MKRIFAALFTAVLVLSGVVFGGVPAMAQTVDNPSIVTRPGGVLVMNSFNPVIFMDSVTGNAAYCIDNNRHVPVPGSVQGTLDPTTIFQPAIYEGFQDLLLAGYPFQNGGLSDIEAQECTQLAVGRIPTSRWATASARPCSRPPTGRTRSMPFLQAY